MFITDLAYNSHNITRYYTMIYVTTCLSQVYHKIVITLHDTTLRFMLLHVYHRSIYNSHYTILYMLEEAVFMLPHVYHRSII